MRCVWSIMYSSYSRIRWTDSEVNRFVQRFRVIWNQLRVLNLQKNFRANRFTFPPEIAPFRNWVTVWNSELSIKMLNSRCTTGTITSGCLSMWYPHVSQSTKCFDEFCVIHRFYHSLFRWIMLCYFKVFLCVFPALFHSSQKMLWVFLFIQVLVKRYFEKT